MNTATSFRRRSLLARGMALAALSSAALALSPLSASAQQWPEKPVTVIVNFPAGGAADRIARAITQPLSEVLGQSFVVENKGGAAGTIGGGAAANSVPYVDCFLMSSGVTLSVNPLSYNNITIDPL